MAYVTTGTISVSNGGTTVTGSGTSWASGPTPLRAEDTIYAGGLVGVVASVSGNTSLTLLLPWTGSTLSGAAYAVCLNAPSRMASTALQTNVIDLVERTQVLASNLHLPKVLTFGANTTPSSPTQFDVHVVGTSPSGAWSGYANNYATWTGSGWFFTAPETGDGAVNLAGSDWYFWSGSSWVARSLTAGALRYDTSQSLSSGDQAQARANWGYAELPFTPIFSMTGDEPSGVTYSSRAGKYIRVGNLYYFDLSVVVSSKGTGGTGTARVGGFPGVPIGGVPIVLRTSEITASQAVVGFMASNGTMLLNSWSGADVEFSNLATSFAIYAGGVYRSA